MPSPIRKLESLIAADIPGAALSVGVPDDIRAFSALTIRHNEHCVVVTWYPQFSKFSVEQLDPSMDRSDRVPAPTDNPCGDLIESDHHIDVIRGFIRGSLGIRVVSDVLKEIDSELDHMRQLCAGEFSQTVEHRLGDFGTMRPLLAELRGCLKEFKSEEARVSV